MMRINNLEPWCYIGILGAILVDWLPIGVGASVIAIFISRVFIRKNFVVKDPANLD